MMHRTVVSCSMIAVIVMAITGHATAAVTQTDVFVGGAEGANGTPYYRIPALTVAPSGNLIAFAEGRRYWNDPGTADGAGCPVDLVSKYSTDGGVTWSPLNVLATSVGASSLYDYADPRVVVDSAVGKVLLLYERIPNGLGVSNLASTVQYYRASSDNGRTWGDSVNINAQVQESSWSGLAVGAGIGIQLRWQADSVRNGRIVVPAWATPDANSNWNYRDLALYSDNHGVTWSHSSLSSVYADENQVVELTNGDLLMDARQQSGIYRTRWISHDGGASWGNAYTGDVPVAAVNCGLIRYSAIRDGGDRNRILFSSPLGTEIGTGNDRGNLAVWTSYDEGKTFINPVQIDSGTCSYSSMQRLPDGSIGVLFERGGVYATSLDRFTLADVEGGVYSRQLTHYDGFGNNIDRKRGGIGWSGSWTGTGVATNAYNSRLGGTGLSVAGVSLATQGGRMDLSPEHTTTERQLAAPINLSVKSTTYLSLMVSQAIDTRTSLTGKALNIQLCDASAVAQLSFGVNDSEQFYLSGLGNALHGIDAINGLATYLLLLKIVAQDAGQPENCDQVYLAAIRSGSAIPDMDVGVNWTFVGSGGIDNSAILDRIRISCGSAASWSFDELRIGDAYGAVVHAPEPASFTLLLIAASSLFWRRRTTTLCKERLSTEGL